MGYIKGSNRALLRTIIKDRATTVITIEVNVSCIHLSINSKYFDICSITIKYNSGNNFFISVLS